MPPAIIRVIQSIIMKYLVVPFLTELLLEQNYLVTFKNTWTGINFQHLIFFFQHDNQYLDFTDGQKDNYLQPEGAQAAKTQPPPAEYLQDNGGNHGDDDFDDDDLLKDGSKQPLLVKGLVWILNWFPLH